MTIRYSAFGLDIDSEIDLPELHTTASSGPADVAIRFAIESIDSADGLKTYAPFLRMAPGRVWLDVEGVAQFRISGGRMIEIRPAPGADEESIRLYVLGSVTGALLSQRGILTLHGNVVRIGDRAMIALGRSGAGKSTLAAGFKARGYDIIADDIAAISARGDALPGIPRIKLWAETAERLSISTAELPRVRPDLEKFQLPLSATAGGAAPVGWIFILQPEEIDRVSIEPLTSLARFPHLIEHTYRHALVTGMEQSGNHMAKCARLASQCQMAIVKRPQQAFMLDALLDALIEFMDRQ